MTTFAHALIGVLPTWRRLCGQDLPLLTLRGRRARLERLQVMRCEWCRSQARCRRRIADGVSRPVRGCPNATLF